MSSLSLPPAEAERCAGQFLAKCYELGLVMNEAVGSGTTHVSTTLQPLTISRAEFDELCHVQSLWNEAVDNTARNFSFLRDALRETAASDDGFTGKLVDILVKVYLGTKPYQKLMLGIFRTDYMRHEDDNGVGLSEASRWRNVEINTISCSFAGLSPLVTKFHEHVGVHLHVWRKANGIVGEKDGSTVSKASGCDGGLVLERSTSGRVVPGAIADAVHAWTKQQKFNLLRESYSQLQACTGCGNDSPQGKLDASPIVLVVVQENERNMADQYALLLKVLEEHHIHFIFRTLQELHMSMKLHYINPNQPPLAVVDGKYPVAVAYFRSTYVPGDLPTDAAWATRLDLERSSAIKCPSIPHHLLTFKKMQQLFCDMDRVLVPIAFRGDSDKARRLKRHFVPQYSLNPCEVGEAAVEEIISNVIRNPERFVLKPQLEGGGNLFSGAPMVKMMMTTREENPVLYSKLRREYIVMSRIRFPVRTGSMLVRGKVVRLEQNLCSEVGIYGVILSGAEGEDEDHDNGKVLLNAFAGYTVRSKPADVDDGGVMMGVAALDSLAVVQ